MIDNPHTRPALPTELRDAVVLLSGGQDSATCLHWALGRYRRVEAVSFHYGQRHEVELDCGQALAEAAGVGRTVLHVPALRDIGAASLTNPGIASAMDADGTGNVYAAEHGLPSSFVPARNAVLLATAMAFAAPLGIYDLVVGVCEADDAGYPDCRAHFIELMERTLRVALDDQRVTIAAPLLHLDKARTFALADELGVLDVVLEDTHTCYNGEHSLRHPWGYGCGECPACQTRAAGWRGFVEAQGATA